ncbi:uncharacterized protein LOC143888007 [Tasmannia lanceolata]|uniref:uncharacterized protein LOC143888007 n=1 Tax=Tasmannia lanceolata TaxID=3420 RepID=UPI004064AFFE
MASLKTDVVSSFALSPPTGYSYAEAPLQMTSIRLDGKNYPPWRRAIRTYLLGRGKVRFLECLPPPTTDPSFEKWEREDAVVRSFLWSCLDSQVAANMMFLDSSKEVWDYATTFSYQALCQQLDLLMSFTVDPVELARRQEEMCVVRYMDSLGPDFLQLRQQIVGSGSLPSLQETFSRVQRMLALPTTNNTLDSSALVTSYGTDRGRGSGRVGRGELRPSRPTASVATSNGSSSALATPTHLPVATLPTADQMVVCCAEYEDLIRLRDRGKQPAATFAQPGSSSCFISHPSSESWLIDSGASHHMIGNFQLLSSFQSAPPIAPRTVTLADGTTSPVSGVGVDLKTGKRIGRGHEIGGLYYLDSLPTGFALRTSADAYQWHCRLGHPPADKLRKSPFINKSIESFSCESCELESTIECLFLRVVVDGHLDLLNLFIQMYGVLPELLLYMVIGILLSLLMISHAIHGYTFSRNVLMCLLLFVVFILKLRINLNALSYFRTDNANEYFSISNGFNQFLDSRGIIHQSSCAYSSQQNGVA